MADNTSEVGDLKDNSNKLSGNKTENEDIATPLLSR